MKKTLVTTILVGLVLGGLIAPPGLAAPPTTAPAGKALYSSRPQDYQPPRLFAPAAPAASPTLADAEPTVPPTTIVADVATQESPASEATVAVTVESTQEDTPVPHSLTYQARPYVSAVPAVTPGFYADTFNARLAKIQLEKHNLTEALALVEKIEMDHNKVQSLVDLAEYVSRDEKYQYEFDILFDLAKNAVDALREGKPIVVKMPPQIAPLAAPPATLPAPVYWEPKTPPKPIKIEEPTLAPLEEAEPLKAPVDAVPSSLASETGEPAAPSTEQPATPSKRPNILLIEEEPGAKAPPASAPAQEETPTPTRRPMPRKRIVTLEEN